MKIHIGVRKGSIYRRFSSFTTVDEAEPVFHAIRKRGVPCCIYHTMEIDTNPTIAVSGGYY
jgi:hypothetical protein